MIKNKCQLEVVRENRNYSFFSDQNSPLTEVIDVLSEMRLYALNVMNDIIKQQDMNKKVEETATEQKSE